MEAAIPHTYSCLTGLNDTQVAYNHQNSTQAGKIPFISLEQYDIHCRGDRLMYCYELKQNLQLIIELLSFLLIFEFYVSCCNQLTQQFYQMRSKIRNETFRKFHNTSTVQNDGGIGVSFSKDEEQNQGLASRSHVLKSNYKYAQKIDKAEEVIKEARQLNQHRVNLIKNAVPRKNLIKKQTIEQWKIHENEQISAQEEKRSHVNQAKILNQIRKKSEFQHSLSKQAEEVDSYKQQVNEREERLPSEPKEILEGDINKSVINIDYRIVKNYFQDKNAEIVSSATPQKIYKIINPLYELCGVKINVPLIKKYKNCAYFGDSKKKEQQNYEGFLIFHQEGKIYYGELQNEKKDGRGTEIDFLNNVISIGNFSRGRKIGKFTVIRPHQRYVGELYKGAYQGQGELTTDFSIYKGSFQKGMRNGEGEETFLQMGLTICGTFVNNKFTNNVQKIEDSRLNTMNSRENTLQNTHRFKGNLAKSINPEKTSRMFTDENVIFESTPQSKQTFQVFDCDFIVENDAFDDIQTIITRKAPAFRIKQVRQPQKAFTERKRAASESKSYMYSTLKN